MSGDALSDWFTTTTLLGITLVNWALVVAVTVGSYLAMTLALRFALQRAGRVAEHTANRVDDVAVEILRGTKSWLIALASLLIGLSLLDLPDRWSARVGQLWFLAVALQVALWANTAIGVGLRHYVARHASSGTTHVNASATLMSWGMRTMLWAIVLLAMLSNLGVNITAFVASLGVGGIAVALAVQNILSDLFASLSIAVDKPFEAGDFIVLNDIVGTVELVGLKTTRIRALSGQQIVVSNTELLKNTINNYKRLMERRIVFKFGVTYDTTPAQAEEIPKIVQRIVQASDKLRFDRAHFLAFGDSSLDYEVVYIVLDPSYNVYMDEQQRINLALMRELDQLGVDFAFPTRTLHVTGKLQQAPDREGDDDASDAARASPDDGRPSLRTSPETGRAFRT
jgi:small-conductance mechanosensitive channel